MESRAKAVGHPIHPMLIVYPLGLFSVAVVFDVLYLVTGNEDLAQVAFWDIAAAILTGLAAALFGFLDWRAIPSGTRAKRVGLWHGSGNMLILALFAVSWLTRSSDPAYAPNLLPFLLALVGAGLSVLTGWLGGELVYRLRVGVDEEAGLDASNSLAPGSTAEERPALGG